MLVGVSVCVRAGASLRESRRQRCAFCKRFRKGREEGEDDERMERGSPGGGGGRGQGGGKRSEEGGRKRADLVLAAVVEGEDGLLLGEVGRERHDLAHLAPLLLLLVQLIL